MMEFFTTIENDNSQDGMSWEIGTACRSSRDDEIAISESGCRVALHQQNVDEVRQVLRGIAFIDSGLDDYRSLVAGVTPGIEVVVLESTQDGVEQISRVLAKRQRIGSIHIVSHGVPGAIYIGNSELSLETLNHYGSELLSWADWLAPDAEVLIYGCEVAKGDRGQAFIHRLSELTGASVHASTARVGNADLETNWRLDRSIPVGNRQSPSQVEPRLAFSKEVIETYSGIFMATFKWSGGGTTNNWTEAANWSLVSGTGSDADGIPDADDVTLFDGTSTKNATINANFSIQNLQVAAAYTGSISLGSNTLAVSGGFAIANANSFDSGTGTVRFTGNQTVDSTAALYNLEVATATGSLTLVKDLVVNNDLTISEIGAITGNGGTFNIKVSGDVITNDANFSNTNSAIQLVGSTDQSISGTGVLVNLDVAKTGGDVLLTDDLRLRGGTLSGSGLLKNAGGKVVFGEPNNFLNDSYTSNFTGSIDDVELKFHSGSNFILSKDLVVNNDLTISEIGAITGNGGTFNIKVTGDVITNDANFSNTNSAIQLVGSTDQSISGTGVLVNLDVAKTGGNVLLTDDLRLRGGTLSGSGLLKNAGGNAGGKVVFGEPNNFLNDSYTSNFTGSIDDVELKFHSGSNFILSKDLVVNNDLTISEIGAITGNGGTFNIKVTGDVITNDANFSNTNSAIQLVGSTDQSISGTGVLVNLDVAKTGGNVLLTDDLRLRGGTLSGSGLLKNAGGNAGGKVIFGEPNNFLNDSYTSNFTGSIDDVELKFHSGSNFILSKDLVVNNDLTISEIGAITGNGGTFNIKVTGDVITNDANFSNTNSAIQLVGSTDQGISGTGVLVNLDVAKTGGNVLLTDDLRLRGGTLSGSGLLKNAGGNAGGKVIFGEPNNFLNDSYTSNFTGSIDDVELKFHSGSNFILSKDLVVNNDLTITQIGAITSSGFSIKVAGDVISSDTNGITGTGAITLVGSATNTFTGLGSGTQGNLVIDKTTSTDKALLGSSETFSSVVINEGIFDVNGKTATAGTTINSGGTLGGSGTVIGNVTVNSGGVLAPGTGIGILNTRSVNFANGSLFNVELGGTSAGNGVGFYDQLNVTGTVTIGTGVVLNTSLFGGFTPGGGNTFIIVNNDGVDAINGIFNGLAQGATVNLGSGINATISYTAGDGNDIGLSLLNQAPNLTGNGTLAAVAEDTTNPNGQTISTVFNGLFSDPDAGASLGGVAVVGNTANATTQGMWQYSTNGTNWFDVGTVADGATALALSASTVVRFVPVANYNGTPPALTVRALDNTYSSGFTSGGTRVNVNTNTNGGTTAISGSTNTINTSISAVNDAPTGTPIATLATGTEDTPYTISKANLLAGFSDVDGDSLSLNNVTVNGTVLTADSSGNYVFTPAANFNGTVNVSYNVVDGKGGSVAATQSFAIAPVNDAPVLTTNTLSITEGGTVTLSSSHLNTSDSDNTPAQLLYTISNISGGTFSGTGVTTNSNGSVSFSQAAINNGLVQFTHNGGENPPSYAVSVSDGQLSTTPATVTIPEGSFTRVNDAPTGTPTATLAAGTEDTVYTISQNALLQGFTDVEGNTLSVAELTASNGTLVNNNNGTYTFTPAANFNGTVNLSYNVVDGNGGSVAATQSFAIAPVNDAPVLVTNTLSITEGGTVTLSSSNLNTSDSDNTPAQLLYTISNISGGTFSGTGVTTNSNGSVSFTQEAINNGLVQFTHNGGENPPSYAVSVNDGVLNTTPVTVTIPAGSFTPVNDAPVLATNTLSITEGGMVTLSSSHLNTSDSDNTPAQLLYTISNISGGSFSGTGVTTNSNGTVSFSQNAINNGLVQFTHNGSENPPSYAVSVSDGALNTNPVTVSIPAGSFIPVNDAPTVFGQGIEDQIISINQSFSLDISNKFSDVDQGDTLTYSATGLPSGFSLNANTGIVSGTIASPGIFNVNVTASDGNGGTVSDAFELIVANNNATPFDDIIYMSQLSGSDKDKVNAKEGRDRVIGTSANEFIGGAEDADYLDGQGGNDKLLGGDGNDTLIGGLGSDDLQGGDGNDTLTGWGSGTGSANQIDELKGGNGADTYILGNSTSVFYNLGGYNDYVKIVGFEAEDRIQLKGTASDYSLGAIPSSVSTDKASLGIFTNSGTELIAVLKNEGLTSTSLTTDARFIFV